MTRKSFLLYDFLLGEFIHGQPPREGPLLPLLGDELLSAEVTVTRGRGFRGGSWFWINIFPAEGDWNYLRFQSDLNKLQSATLQLRADLLEARLSDFSLVALLRYHWRGEDHSSLRKGFRSRWSQVAGPLADKFPSLEGRVWAFLLSNITWNTLMWKVGLSDCPLTRGSTLLPDPGGLEGPLALGDLPLAPAGSPSTQPRSNLSPEDDETAPGPSDGPPG